MSLDMKCAFHVLTAFWAGLAMPSLLPAGDRAESHVPPQLQQKTRHEPSGLALASPFVRGKIPVVFVHGLWATPASWRKMIESLTADHDVDRRFQFWTFGYSTGNPIAYSAYLLRRDLAATRRRLDPDKTDSALDRMVLVGHSMGGLLCKMITVDPGDRLWRAISDHPVDELKGEANDVALMRDCLIFGPSPVVHRVIYIATPHRGSRVARGSLRAIGTRLVLLPDALRATHYRLVAKNPPEFFHEPFHRHLPSSIDELEWDSPMLTGLMELAHPPVLKVHSIIAVCPGASNGQATDGVVSYESAHLRGAVSEKLICAGHLCQENPEVTGEVRRLLLEHAGILESPGQLDKGGESPRSQRLAAPDRYAKKLRAKASPPRGGSSSPPAGGSRTPDPKTAGQLRTYKGTNFHER